ncbi:MAG: hypothetical protein LBQ88_13875 [Treponema sp.]|jgi:hypothetical protein|nr:hypothetical protein [Treponema sp.]
MNINEIREELFREEYPALRPNSDPDIERYCYLRTSGFPREALNLYESRLRPRYPNDEFRTALLRTYRNRDPIFPQLLTAGYRRLAELALDKTKKIISFIAKKIETYNPRDVYSTLKTVEDILKILPQDRYAAMSMIDRYYEYSRALKFEVKLTGKAASLIRAYLDQSLGVVGKEMRRRENKKQQEAERERQRRIVEDWRDYERQKTHGIKAEALPLLDMSAVVFSPRDLARIEIPSIFTSLEDKTLAYCLKYWNLVNDNAFERVLYLYSRKYGVKNYDAYKVIRTCRLRNMRDDEILTQVMSSLMTGYYYSVKGDRYLQQQWNAMKAYLIPPAGETAEVPKQKKVKQAGKAAVEKAAAGREKVKPDSKAAIEAAPRQKRVRQSRKAAVPAGAGLIPAGRQVTQPVPAALPRKRERPAALPEAAKISGEIPLQTRGKTNKAGPTPAEKGESMYTIKSHFQRPEIKAGGSVADRLRELSGRSYDIYQDRFLANAMSAIRKVLGAKKGIFFTLPERVETLIFTFFKEHYSDPYMNWAESRERAEAASLGFDVPSLDPIISECFKKL